MNINTIHHLTQEELKELLSIVTSKRDKALTLLAYSYGLTASEVGLLRQKDVNFDRTDQPNPRRTGGEVLSLLKNRPDLTSLFFGIYYH